MDRPPQQEVRRLGEGKITHLCKEHRENSQADPVDDAGKLECIIDCRNKGRTTDYLLGIYAAIRFLFLIAATCCVMWPRRS